MVAIDWVDDRSARAMELRARRLNVQSGHHEQAVQASRRQRLRVMPAVIRLAEKASLGSRWGARSTSCCVPPSHVHSMSASPCRLAYVQQQRKRSDVNEQPTNRRE